jgi:hypothetical protein
MMDEVIADNRFGHTLAWDALDELDALIARVDGSPRFRSWLGAPRRVILSLLFVKAVKTYRAIRILCEQGYGEDATVLLRSLFQVVVTAQYLVHEDSRRRVAAYVGYYPVANLKLLDPAMADPQFAARMAARGGVDLPGLRRTAGRAKKRFKFSPTSALAWAGVTLRKAARDVGQGESYDSLYRIASGFEHSSAGSLLSYGSGPDPTGALPSASFVNKTLVACLIQMLILLEVIIRAFKLGMVRDLSPLVARGGRLVRDLTDAGALES